MKALLQFLVESIAQNPKEVKIKENTTGDLVELTIQAHPDDLKIIIGKGGRTIKAIREVVRIKALMADKKVKVNIEENLKK